MMELKQLFHISAYTEYMMELKQLFHISAYTEYMMELKQLFHISAYTEYMMELKQLFHISAYTEYTGFSIKVLCWNSNKYYAATQTSTCVKVLVVRNCLMCMRKD